MLLPPAKKQSLEPFKTFRHKKFRSATAEVCPLHCIIKISSVQMSEKDSCKFFIWPLSRVCRFARGTEGSCFGGNYNAGRTNELRVDLNRDFPSWRNKGQTLDQLKEGRQKETLLAMDWILAHPFALSANFHDGAVLANYPYDDYR